MPNFSFDFLDIHNDDLVPVAEYEGITIYNINYSQALDRRVAFIQKIVKLRTEREKQ